MIRGMNILLAIAITTGILSGIWGWVAVSLGLLSWAGFLGCTAYFACPQGGLKGLLISACTLLSGMVWALVIIHGSALAPHLDIVSYALTRDRGIPDVYPGKAVIAFFRTRNVYRCLCNICGAGRLATGVTVVGAGATLWLRYEK